MRRIFSHILIAAIFSLLLQESSIADVKKLYVVDSPKIFLFDSSQFNNITAYTLKSHLLSICESNSSYFRTCPAADLPEYYLKPDSKLSDVPEVIIPKLNRIYAFNDYVDVFFKDSNHPPSVIVESSGEKPRLVLSPLKSTLQFIRHDKSWLDKNGRKIISAKVFGNDSVALDLSNTCGFEIINYKPGQLRIKLRNCSEIKVAIDPGHGGSETGACVDKICESNLSYSLAVLTQTRLSKEKIDSFLTRSKDETLTIEDRLKRVEESRASLLVSLHFDKWEANNYMPKPPSGMGCYYFYRFFSKAAERLCGGGGFQGIQAGQISQRSLYMLQSYNFPSVIVEVANLASKDDLTLIGSEEFLPNAAEYLAETIASLVKLKAS